MTDTETTPNPDAVTAKCLWCGSARPVEVPVCPTCEHAWVDATIEEARAGQLEPHAVSSQMGVAPSSRWERRRWIPLVVALALAAVYGATLLGGGDSTTPNNVAATTNVPQVSSTAVVTTSAPPPSTRPPITTTLAPTTTTTTTTSSTLPPIAVVEPPYDLSSLTLGAFALGPIRFGSTDPDVVGRLAATFGQPTARQPAGEDSGLCAGDTGSVIEFGGMSVILRDEGEGQAFVGYRLHSNGQPGNDPASTLESISGLTVGDPLSRARGLYSRVDTSQLEGGAPIYLVRRSSDGRTLLWGEISLDADPEILSINSPRSCDGGPFAS